MAELQKPTDRLVYTAELEPVFDRMAEAYGISEVTDHSVIEIGYEDCNVVLQTDNAKYVAKLFAKTRKPDEVKRYADIMEHVVEAGVNYPALVHQSDGSVVYTDSQANGLTGVLMQFIDGKTFFELDRAPDDQDLEAVIEQAAKINEIDYKPPYLFDSWAIPNIRSMYDRVKSLITEDDLQLVERAMTDYEAIPVNELPHAFVHGDFTKANIIKSSDGKIYILDFSVANWYPRIQELAVIIANLMHDEQDTRTLAEKCGLVGDTYSRHNELTELERQHLLAYTIAGIAMEFMGAHQEKHLKGNDTDETDYWLKLGREGLRKALA